MRIGKKEITGIIFDMDGTLLDSMPEWENTARRVTEYYQLFCDKEVCDVFMKSPAENIGYYLKSRFDLKNTVKDIAGVINDTIFTAYSERMKTKPYIPELLDYLKNERVKLAVATATEKNTAVSALKLNHILDYFEAVVSCDELHTDKHSPEVYFEALKRIAADQDSVAVAEDALYAACTAKEAGFFVIGVKDDSMESDWEKMLEISDVCIHSAKELIMKG
ncbi:MAG: HAD family phosphatase [Clostridia bacterium]|nr:HAD family phosphatase [Clostridia bacterium]